MELELRMLDRRYASLRVLALDRLAPLMASLAEIGQQSPVLVVESAPEGSPEQAGAQPVLIDGYRRVLALERLGRDTVMALPLGLDEAEALLLRHRLAADERRSALEDGWLVRELHEVHGLSQRDLAQRLSRSPSWVSRRLGLVRDLPESVQELVRQGVVPAQAAMKYLLPLSRDNAQACEELAGSLKGSRWTVRQLGQVYLGWRLAGPEVRQRILQEPSLYCRALREVASDTSAPLAGESEVAELLRGLERLARICRRVRHGLSEGLRLGVPIDGGGVLGALWNEAERAYQELRETVVRVFADA